MRTSQLIAQIQDVFKDVPRADTSLFQYVLTDQKGISGSITDKEWNEAGVSRTDNTWTDIQNDQIEDCDCQLAHMTPKDFTYYLPAYMCYSLSSIETKNLSQDILGSTLHSLYPSKKDTSLYNYSLNLLSFLNITQQNIIIDFLEFVSVNANEFDYPYARKSLERYWYARKSN